MRCYLSVIDGGEARLHRATTGVSMRALEFWKVVTVDKSGFLDRMVGLLGEHWIRYCVVGGMQ